jgi:hypothetical protein
LLFQSIRQQISHFLGLAHQLAADTAKLHMGQVSNSFVWSESLQSKNGCQFFQFLGADIMRGMDIKRQATDEDLLYLCLQHTRYDCLFLLPQ